MPHFFGFLMCAAFLGTEVSDSKGKEKQSHLSHLSPLSHFQVLQWSFGGKDRRAVELGIAANWEGGSQAGRAALRRPHLG
jgi:hypothetical protein